jgi:hypothetical protein
MLVTGSAEVSVSRRIPLRLFFPEQARTVPHCGIRGFLGQGIKRVVHGECKARTVKGGVTSNSGKAGSSAAQRAKRHGVRELAPALVRQAEHRWPEARFRPPRRQLRCRTRAPESALGRRGESPLQVNVTCNRLQLRRRETGWRAAGGERPVRKKSLPEERKLNSIRPVRGGEPASERRSPEFPQGTAR